MSGTQLRGRQPLAMSAIKYTSGLMGLHWDAARANLQQCQLSDANASGVSEPKSSRRALADGQSRMHADQVLELNQGEGKWRGGWMQPWDSLSGLHGNRDRSGESQAGAS